MASDGTDPLDRLVQAVLHGARYRGISVDLIRTIGRRELAAHRRPRDAVKATRNRLHQIYGAFLIGEPRYAAWLRDLAAAIPHGDQALRAACLRIMAHHASTRERLAFLPAFYATTLAGLSPPRSVLDIACGLHPLALPWLPLAAGATYRCYDIDAGLVGFLNDFFRLAGLPAEAQVRDVAADPPDMAADLALLLKALPTLDRLDRAASGALLRAVRADRLLVSFPAHTLGGRDKGLAEHHEARFTALAHAEGWSLERFLFPTELAFLVHRSA